MRFDTRKIENLLDKAQSFAKSAHNSINHRRKYTDEPYWVHPERVANIVASVTDEQAVIAAAWLHDVIEDVAPLNQGFNEEAIFELFGHRVLQLVLEVTDVSTLEDGNRAQRKALDRKHLAKASNGGKLIKLADLIDNVIDLTQYDRGFAKIFKKEALLDLPFLKSGDDVLFVRLQNLLDD